MQTMMRCAPFWMSVTNGLSYEQRVANLRAGVGLVRRARVEKRRHQVRTPEGGRVDLVAPQIPALREAVQQHHEGAIALDHRSQQHAAA